MKQHNDFTNHEVELIRKHWPSRMPMVELLALLPRHTEHSITGYANKKLNLRRPHVKTVMPAWARLRAMLEQNVMTQTEIAAAMGFSRTRASELLGIHRAEVFIKSWRWPEGPGRAESQWTFGSEPDAPEPMGYQRSRRGARRSINPFLPAAGMVQAPASQIAGRVYKQAMNLDEEAA